LRQVLVERGDRGVERFEVPAVLGALVRGLGVDGGGGGERGGEHQDSHRELRSKRHSKGVDATRTLDRANENGAWSAPLNSRKPGAVARNRTADLLITNQL